MVFCGVRTAQKKESYQRRWMGFLQENINVCCAPSPRECELIIIGSAIVSGDFVIQMVLSNYYIVKCTCEMEE